MMHGDKVENYSCKIIYPTYLRIIIKYIEYVNTIRQIKRVIEKKKGKTELNLCKIKSIEEFGQELG